MNLPLLDRPQAAPGRAVPPIAALPMYDWPELQEANDTLWLAISSRLQGLGEDAAPAQLTRSHELFEVWTSPALLLAQTCGYPLMTRLKDQVQLVATPRYRAPGCEGPFRRSAIVVHARSRAERLADLRGARCAVNDWASDSGMNLLRAAVAPLANRQAFFAGLSLTGSHLASAEAVADGAADVAALDAVSYAHLQRLRPAVARRLRLLQWTARTPGLPLITAGAASPARVRALRQALSAIASDPALAHARRMLLLDDMSSLPLAHYRLTLHMEERARALGYPTLQ